MLDTGPGAAPYAHNAKFPNINANSRNSRVNLPPWRGGGCASRNLPARLTLRAYRFSDMIYYYLLTNAAIDKTRIMIFILLISLFDSKIMCNDNCTNWENDKEAENKG
jgi:hypothetical protein